MSGTGAMNGFKSYAHPPSNGLHYWSSEPSVYQTAPPTSNRMPGMSSYYADTSAALQTHNLTYQGSAAAAVAAASMPRTTQFSQIKPEVRLSIQILSINAPGIFAKKINRFVLRLC